MMSSRGSWLLSVAIVLCIGGMLFEDVEAACNTVANCLDCSSSAGTGVCTNCSRLYGLDYKTPTSTLCTQCSTKANCAECVYINNCTKCSNVATMGPDYGQGSCSSCSANCQRCGTAGGGKCNICSAGYIVDPSTQLCVGCSSNCSNCGVSGAGKCDVCNAGFGIDSNQLCVPCMTGCAQCARNVSNCTVCTSAKQAPLRDGSGNCADCASNCEGCTVSGPGQCDNCTSPYTKTTDAAGKTSCVNAACPIVPRSAWTTSTCPPSVPALVAADLVVFHLTMLSTPTTPAACEAQLRIIENYQISKGHACIVYNFLICGDGMVYEGRGAFKQGAAKPLTWNSHVISVAMMGIFTPPSTGPNTAQLAAACKLLGQDCESSINIAAGPTKYNHHSDIDCSTRCPAKGVRVAINATCPEHQNTANIRSCDPAQRAFPTPLK